VNKMPNTLKDNAGIQPELSEVLAQGIQANSVAADVATLVTDFNALLAKLRAAGILST
jgi:hypothetical protein